MSIGREEIFGPVLCIKRVKNFEEGLKIMNNNRFANGSVIYTQNGYYARKFVKETDGGMVGINVGIPVPVGIFGFTGTEAVLLRRSAHDGPRWFHLLYGKQECYPDLVRGRSEDHGKVDTWDGMMNALAK